MTSKNRVKNVFFSHKNVVIQEYNEKACTFTSGGSSTRPGVGSRGSTGSLTRRVKPERLAQQNVC